MNTQKQRIIVNGKDKTDAIVSYQFVGEKCNVIYNNSDRVYSYNREKVRVIPLCKSIDPQSEVELASNCLANKNSRELFEYFKATAAATSLVSDNGKNILQSQYDRIAAVSEETVLSNYLNENLPIKTYKRSKTVIYPFGLNQSQKLAVENAFSSQISIIQGPPGTGKTQTILNIIANAVYNGKTVAVVSNNNSATMNVVEKLKKKDLSFLTAYLGNSQNKNHFLEDQTGIYPNMEKWVIERERKQKLFDSVKQLSEELNSMLDSKNRIAAIEQELLAIKPEQFYFKKYYSEKKHTEINPQQFTKLSSDKLLSLWIEYEDYAERNAKPSLFKKIVLAFRFSKAALMIFKKVPEKVVPFLQDLYYKHRISELQSEKSALEAQLVNYRFDEKMEELSQKSMKLFKAELAQRYCWQSMRKAFEKKDFYSNSDEFTKEYPVVLSTTYSIKGTLSIDFVYDYLIVDEASQVDLATGVLAFSCAKNIVIVGDEKQLPNVLTSEEIRIADAIWNKHTFDERYHFSTHSILASAVEIWKDAPSVLLREHYRCHPKIAGFFNQKFYHGELIVMTKDCGESDVLSVYRTVTGNHARGRMNQRQIDVIQQEILPNLRSRGYQEIGIITPYRDQVTAIKRQLGQEYEIDTVHKFQGREKEAIVLASVDNVIGEFVDDPNMLNVAVSRAVKSLSVVISDSKENEKTNYGDLVKYIRYNNFEIVDSQVFSVFDLLYKGYYAQRLNYLKQHKKISEFDSENLAHSVIESILQMPRFSKIDCIVHSSLATLVKDDSLLTESERRYASNPLTHIDFLLFNRMDKASVMAIEIDGTKYHAEGSRQAERDALKDSVLAKSGISLLRIRTNESGEKERILSMLDQCLG